MAVSCPNCKIPFTGCAGAKIAKASNGATVCTKCIGAYETNLKNKGATSQSTAPSNITLIYNGPQKL